MQCQYCGAVQAVPDLAMRQQALLERERVQLQRHQSELAEQRHREEAARAAHRDHLERQERRSSIRWGRLVTIFSMLLAPVIVSITVFDLPARLGFGDAGADRLTLVATQFEERGCKVIAPPVSLYSSGTVSQLVKVESGCLRVLAAGGPSHTSLTVRIFDLDGKQVEKSESSSDPQAEYCPAQPGSLRYEVVPGMSAKGRLTHLAMLCPPAAPADQAAPASEGRPKKSRR